MNQNLPKKAMFSRIFKFISVLIFIYFVAMMIVLGNGSSFMGRYLQSVFNPVANLMGLNTTWNFFSPDPAHTMYLKYFVFFEDDYGNSTKDPIEGYFPGSKDEGGDFRLDKRRNSYAMRFLAIDPYRLEVFFTPWMCRQYPDASKIQVELIVNRIPPLDQVVEVVNKNINDYDNLVRQEEVSRYIFGCPNAS